MEAGPKVEIRFISKEEVERLINVKDAVYAAEEAFRALGEGQISQLHPGLKIKGRNIINTMPAFIKSKNLYGMKQVNVYYEREPGDNLPRIWGSLIVLTNPDNALPYAIMDGTSITNMRTAGGHAVVAAKYLARKDSKTLAIIGCGAEARTGFQSLMNNFKLEMVKVYDIKTEEMASFTSEMDQDHGVEIISVDSIEEAVSGADLVWMVTSAPKSVLLHEGWVEKGSFVAGLSGFRDIDPKLSHMSDKWVLGTHEGDGELIDRKVDMFPEGISKGDVYADMGEIVTGVKAGRENNDERIVYTHMGMGGHDVLLAQIAYERASERDLGTKLYL
jgi:ornithine cyclodeaminase/alanine dehydrogenase-like protein (mu-crystallin family)